MASADWVLLLLFFSIVCPFSNLSAEVRNDRETGKEGLVLGYSEVERRALMRFKETPNVGNVTCDCSPSGPCVPCAYSEKLHRRETGYCIPLKCVETESSSKRANGKKKPKDRSALESRDAEAKRVKEFNSSMMQRILLDEASSLEGGIQAYITYLS